MFNLMKLELKKNNVKTYVKASLIICVIMAGMLYLLAYTSYTGDKPELKIFTGYNDVIPMFSIFTMSVFAILSAVMYTKFIIEEYKDKRLILLFSYPVKRSKILLVKVAIVFVFTVVATAICNLLIFGIFGISESISPLVDDVLSIHILISVIKISVIMAIVAAAFGAVAMGIGFIKKSIPATIVSAVILSSFYSNIMGSTTSSTNKSDILSIVFMGIAIIISAIVVMMVMKKISHMEVE